MKLLQQLKPQDIVVVTKLLLWRAKERWTYETLGNAVGLSASQTHGAIGRLIACHLVDAEFKQPIKRNLIEFLEHGLRYVFPIIPGGIGTGIPTAHSGPLMKSKIIHHQDQRYVWASNIGSAKQKGITIVPLHKDVPKVANKDRELYEILTVIDALRMNSPREREVACELIQKLILER